MGIRKIIFSGSPFGITEDASCLMLSRLSPYGSDLMKISQNILPVKGCLTGRKSDFCRHVIDPVLYSGPIFTVTKL